MLFLLQTGYEKNLFGNRPVSFSEADSRDPPPAFASDPLVYVSGNGGIPTLVGKDGSYLGTSGSGSTKPLTIGMEGNDNPSAAIPSLSNNESDFMSNSSPVSKLLLLFLHLSEVCQKISYTYTLLHQK